MFESFRFIVTLWAIYFPCYVWCIFYWILIEHALEIIYRVACQLNSIQLFPSIFSLTIISPFVCSVKTDLMENGANSTLFIAKVRKTDTGNYTCSIGPNGSHTINVQVLKGNLLHLLFGKNKKSHDYKVPSIVCSFFLSSRWKSCRTISWKCCLVTISIESTKCYCNFHLHHNNSFMPYKFFSVI